jgi:hypothetical protein
MNNISEIKTRFKEIISFIFYLMMIEFKITGAYRLLNISEYNLLRIDYSQLEPKRILE